MSITSISNGESREKVRKSKVEVQRAAELEAQRAAELEAQRAAELEAQRAAGLEAQCAVELEAAPQEHKPMFESEPEYFSGEFEHFYATASEEAALCVIRFVEEIRGTGKSMPERRAEGKKTFEQVEKILRDYLGMN